jgi:hypothetical protein
MVLQTTKIFYLEKKIYYLLRIAVGEIAPRLNDTIKAIPVSISETLKSIAKFRSVVTFNDVNDKSARFSISSAISPFHLFYKNKKER